MGIAQESDDMVDLNDRDYEVLAVLAERTSNPYYIREQTGLSKRDVNTVLVKLTRDDLASRVTQGLYEITDEGRDRLEDDA